MGYSHYPHSKEFDERDSNEYKKRREPFSMFSSYKEKTFRFSPQPYEYCQVKNNVKGKTRCDKMYPKKARQLTYGITILQSSVPEDQDYTLAGMTKKNVHYQHANLSNWFPETDTTRDYWYHKIEERRGINGNKTDDYLLLYEKISTKLKPDSLYENMNDTDSVINLSDLLLLLKYGMGFTNINIIESIQLTK